MLRSCKYLIIVLALRCECFGVRSRVGVVRVGVAYFWGPRVLAARGMAVVEMKCVLSLKR